jgi:chloramphenicol-sensitive protein RarD
MTTRSRSAHESSTRAGLAYGLAAFGFWGLVPIYFKAVSSVPALEVLAHRVVWSVVVLGVVLSLKHRWPEVAAAFTDWKTLGVLALTTVLIGANWFIFIWAVNNDQVLQASLGYFINPLVNVFLGVVFLKERLSRAGIVAVAMAATGVGWLTVRGGELPWISLVLAFSFGLYGLLRKTARVKPVPGLMVETMLMLPPALIYLAATASHGGLYFGTGSLELDLLLVAAGLVTAIPLLWFTAAAQILPLSTMGFIQYLAPTLHFGLAVMVYGEPLTGERLIAFFFIWVALAIFTVDQLRRQPTDSASGVDSGEDQMNSGLRLPGNP